jgi:transcriptional regulator GlxA family with amidase domain
MDAWTSSDDWVAEQATHQHLEAGWFRRASLQDDHGLEVDPVGRATAFISTHYASPLDVEWIARNVSFVSASHLTRLFRRKLGGSPHAFIKQVRLDSAAQMLTLTPLKVGQIAQRVGYCNASHFVKDFRRYFGTPPASFRKKARLACSRGPNEK